LHYLGAEVDANSLQLFACIVQSGNLSAAARALKMTRSNVSRRLHALESTVGTRLMHRTTHAVSLTAAGDMLYTRARNVAREIAAAQAELCGNDGGLRGKLKIALPRSVAQFVLANVVTQFALDHPGVSIEVLYSNEARDLHVERIDLFLRIASHPIESAVVVWRGDVEQSICASPAYVNRCGAPRSLAELREHSVVSYAVSEGVIPITASRGAVREQLVLNAQHRANDLEFVREAACAGVAIALLARYTLGRDVREGRLIELLPEYSFTVNRSKLYLQAQEARYQSAVARLLAARIRERLQNTFVAHARIEAQNAA